MATVDRILVPTDFSSASINACRFANNIADKLNAVADLIHVIPLSVLFDDLIKESIKPRKNGVEKEDLYPLIYHEAEKKLATLLADEFSPSCRGESFLISDRTPAKAIADFAQEGKYSMICMSARGKDESGFFRGTTTEDVIRWSRVPVLSVQQGGRNLEGGRIVVPVDGSVLSMAATPFAALLATVFNAKITYLYIHEVLGFFGKHVPDTPDDIQNRRTAEYLMDQLMEFLDVAKPDGLHVMDSEDAGLTALIYNNQEVAISFEIITGFSAHHEITQYANKFAGLVVMATHGRSGLSLMIMGSQAGKVSLNAESSVLTVRPEPNLFQKNNLQSSAS